MVAEKSSVSKWFIPALFICFFAVGGNAPILRLFSVSIANDLQVPVGVAAQLGTINSVAEIALAVLMAFLVVRFNHKSLLLAGIGIVAISSVGSFLAPTIGLMLLFFAMEGAGTVIVVVMGLTLIGELLPLKEKGKAIGGMIAAGSVAAILGSFALGFIANASGWRSAFIIFVLPVTAVGLLAAFFTLPSRPDEKPFGTGGKAYLSSFKEVFLNKSAASCLLGGLLMSATGLAVFATAFFFQHFSISLWTAVMLNATAAVVVVVASIVTGRLINKFGRKTLTVSGAFVGSVLAIPIFFMPNLWLAMALNIAHIWFIWTGITAYQSYVLEQTPRARGTMMSMRNIFSNTGEALGGAIGGALLVLFSFNLALSYQTIGITFGAIGIAGSAVFYLFTKDPTLA